MDTLFPFAIGTALLIVALVFWAIVSRSRSPLLTIMPHDHSPARDKMLTVVSLICGMLSIIMIQNGFATLYPDLRIQALYQNLIVFYVPAFGMAYILGGLFPKTKNCSF